MTATLRSPFPGRLCRAIARWQGRRLSEAGYAAILVAIIVPTVGIGLAATAVDTGRWYVEVQTVQRAVDAAVLAGVPYLPQDMASAVVRAKDVAKRNGYDDASAGVTVTVESGKKATQLKVTIASVVENVFGSMIGVPRATISRSAVADYQGPAPMGSPCNTFGNEPSAGSGGISATPSGTARGSSPLPNCLATPQYWATVEGPETGKVQGDRYQTRKCEAAGVDGCSSLVNDEYDPFGYVFVVKVAQPAVGTQVDLQLYDPMFVNTGNACALLPQMSAFPADTVNTNPYVRNDDARNRYTRDGPTKGTFCTGDSYPGTGSGQNPKHALTTSFVLRQQTDSQNPKVAAVQNGSGGSPCIRQYGSANPANSVISADLFKQGAASYNEEISSQFHNWVSFCSFTPDRAGDYYLQVRTNVSISGSGGVSIRSGNTAAAAVAGNTTMGEGSNAFAIRAVTLPGRELDLAVSGYAHMPIFVNSDSALVEFNLIRVLPGAAGQKISFSYFDAGDAQGSGSVRVLTPTDATGSITATPFPGGCSAYGGSAGGSPASQTTLIDCTAPITKVGTSSTSKNNGKVETITIPIPSDYTCNFNSFGGCWYRVQVAFGSGGVSDVTTWSATVEGDPVRLME